MMLLNVISLCLSCAAIAYAAWVMKRAGDVLEESNRALKFALGRLAERRKEVAALKQILIEQHHYDAEDLEWIPSAVSLTEDP